MAHGVAPLSTALRHESLSLTPSKVAVVGDVDGLSLGGTESRQMLLFPRSGLKAYVNVKGIAFATAGWSRRAGKGAYGTQHEIIIFVRRDQLFF